MPYKDYLCTREWAVTRHRQLKFAEFRCQVCNAPAMKSDTRRSAGLAALEVHHRTYIRLGEERIQDCIVLCRECHALFHHYGRLVRDAS